MIMALSSSSDLSDDEFGKMVRTYLKTCGGTNVA